MEEIKEYLILTLTIIVMIVFARLVISFPIYVLIGLVVGGYIHHRIKNKKK